MVPTTYDEEEFDFDDRDAPLPQDLTDDDDDETPTVPCSSCGQEIPDFVDRCPYCGDWVVQQSGPTGGKGWMAIAAIIALAGFLIWLIR